MLAASKHQRLATIRGFLKPGNQPSPSSASSAGRMAAMTGRLACSAGVYRFRTILYDFELEPEVREWLESLGDSDFRRADEVCGLLAEKGSELGGPV